MKNQNVKTPETLVNLLSKVMPRQNGSPAGFAALQASLLRGKELVK